MNKYFRQTLLFIMLILPLNLWGMNKEFTISIKDASNIKTMFQKNIKQLSKDEFSKIKEAYPFRISEANVK